MKICFTEKQQKKRTKKQKKKRFQRRWVEPWSSDVEGLRVGLKNTVKLIVFNTFSHEILPVHAV